MVMEEKKRKVMGEVKQRKCGGIGSREEGGKTKECCMYDGSNGN